MLRPRKLRPFELKILWGMALLLAGASLVGLLLGIDRGDWRIFFVSVGIGGLAALYVAAAKRGRPL